MKLPKLRNLAAMDVILQIADGTDENGSANIIQELPVKARCEQSSSVVYTKDGVKTTAKFKLTIFDTLFYLPDNASGFCIVEGVKYDIARISKKRNPDGSIHHIILELI